VLRRNEELLVGATVEDSGFDNSTTDAGRDELRTAALGLFPKLQWKKITRHWAGLRPATPDGLPILGQQHGERVILATGHYRNGILLAPWTARVVADLLAHGHSSELPEEFSPHRF
jgi:thiazole synthase